MLVSDSFIDLKLCTYIPTAEELNGIRDAYRLQLAAIRDEREGISQALHALHIKEESLRRREEELHQTHQSLEAKELFYRTKGEIPEDSQQ